jgi:type II secretory pathway pseudopilin PulG
MIARGRKFPARRGFTLVETGIAAVMLAIAMGLTVQVVAWVAAERRASERRRCAVQEVANLMERVTAQTHLTPEAARAFLLSEPARGLLPGAELSVSVEEVPAGSRRVSLRLRWKDRAGDWDAPVRLTSWVGRRNGGPP